MNRTAILRTIELTHELEAKGTRLEMAAWGGQTYCDTIGCLAGHMTLDPELRAVGLRNAEESDRVGLQPHCPIFKTEHIDSSGYRALELFLDLDTHQVMRVFGHNNPNSWPAARQRLESLLDG